MHKSDKNNVLTLRQICRNGKSWIFWDFLGRRITLSEDSWLHIQREHPEISIQDIAQTLVNPEEVRKSLHRNDVELYYCIKNLEPKPRFINVVVKLAQEKYFISTAMTTRLIRRGEVLFRKQ